MLLPCLCDLGPLMPGPMLRGALIHLLFAQNVCLQRPVTSNAESWQLSISYFYLPDLSFAITRPFACNMLSSNMGQKKRTGAVSGRGNLPQHSLAV